MNSKWSCDLIKNSVKVNPNKSDFVTLLEWNNERQGDDFKYFSKKDRLIFCSFFPSFF